MSHNKIMRVRNVLKATLVVVLKRWTNGLKRGDVFMIDYPYSLTA